MAERPAINKGNFTLNIKNWPFWVGIVCIAVGIFFAVSILKPSLFQKLIIAGITEIGFAFFIAHIIIITVDRQEKIALRNEMRMEQRRLETERRVNEKRVTSKLYLSTILEVDLPNDISDELTKYILASKMLKREQSLRYKLSKLGNHVKLVQSFDATYENLDKEPIQYNPPFSTFNSHLTEILKIHPTEKFGLMSLTISVKRSNESTIKKIVSWSITEEEQTPPTNLFENGAWGIKLKNPIELEYGDQVRLQLEVISPKYSNDNEIFTHANFTETSVMNVDYDKKIFEVGYRCIHPRANECMNLTKGVHSDSINFNYPFLPSNGVIVWWKEKQPVDPTDPPQ